MRRLCFAAMGLFLGGLVSQMWGGCCGDSTPLSPGVYGYRSGNTLDVDYRLTISPDLTTVSEVFARNGVRWSLDYEVTGRFRDLLGVPQNTIKEQ